MFTEACYFFCKSHLITAFKIHIKHCARDERSAWKNVLNLKSMVPTFTRVIASSVEKELLNGK